MPLAISLPHIGTAGWSYPQWDGIVYPKPQTRGLHPLEYMSRFVDLVEVNSSFYRPLQPEVTKVWIKKVEANRNFRFTAKLHQRFTHWRTLQEGEVKEFKDGLTPLLRAGKLGALLMQFPWSFRFTAENRDFLIQLRRAFHEFPLVAEMRHASWMSDEGLGTFIDYKLGFCNIDQPEYTKAMPPTSFLTSAVGYVRLHGRNPGNSLGAFQADAPRQQQHNYLYSPGELMDWKKRIEKLKRHAEEVYVVFNNDPLGKSLVNSLQMQHAFDSERRLAPYPLLCRYRMELEPFTASRRAMDADHRQPCLFEAA
ncbi:MAG TPA: DUF72 domain-containing protein [Bryobacteraceae bacterium]